MSASIGTAYFRVAPDMSGVQSKISSGLKGTGSSFAEQFGGEVSGKSAIIVGAIAGVASVAAQKAFSLISSSIGDAVSRVDTLNNAPKVLQNLGFSAADSAASISKLATGIKGLPTRLDSASTALTQIAAASGYTISKATDLTLAFNNMALAGGKGPEGAAEALTQFTQGLGKGKLQMQDFQTLAAVMPAQLKQIAITLLGSGNNAQTLQAALSDGKVTIGQFSDAIIALNKNGGPGFASFAQQAKDATSGINTGFANMQASITRGIAKIITAVGSKNISNAIASIGKGFETVLGIIAKDIPIAVNAIKGFFDFINRNKDIFGPIAVGIGAATAALVLYNATVKISSVVTAAYIAISKGLALVFALQAQGLGLARAAWLAFNIVLNTNPIVLIATALVALTAGLTYFFTQTKTGQQVFSNFTGFVSSAFSTVQSAISAVINFVRQNWPLLLGILTGPFGLAVLYVVQHFQQIQSAVSNTISSVVSFFSALPSRIVSALGNLGGSLYNIGRNMIQGLLDGAGSLLSTIGTFFLSKLPSFIQGPFKKALGIKSPSKVFAGFGANISQGLANGVSDNASAVTSAITGLANSAISSFGAGNLTADIAATATPANATNYAAVNGLDDSNKSIQNDFSGANFSFANAEASKAWWAALNEDTMRTSMGLTPVQGATA